MKFIFSRLKNKSMAKIHNPIRTQNDVPDVTNEKRLVLVKFIKLNVLDKAISVFLERQRSSDEAKYVLDLIKGFESSNLVENELIELMEILKTELGLLDYEDVSIVRLLLKDLRGKAIWSFPTADAAQRYKYLLTSSDIARVRSLYEKRFRIYEIENLDMPTKFQYPIKYSQLDFEQAADLMREVNLFEKGGLMARLNSLKERRLLTAPEVKYLMDHYGLDMIF